MMTGETGLQLIARLGTKPSLVDLERHLFVDGPKPREVIELYGEEGSGKTQLLLHFIARCILPKTWHNATLNGLDAAVVFIDTDYHFQVMRLLAILEATVAEALGAGISKETEQDAKPSDEAVETFLKGRLRNLHVVRCNSSNQLFLTLHSLEGLIGSEPNISVIMVDSISAFYWTDRISGGDNHPAQESMLKKITGVLQKLVHTYNLVLIATKHAIFQRAGKRVAPEVDTTDFSISGEPSRSQQATNHCEYLCKSWQRLVTQRFVLSQEESLPSDEQTNASRSCFASAKDAPEQGPKKYFTIGDKGVEFHT